MKLKINKRSSRFTLVELMLAMSIFAVLMLILMQIFGSTQDVWRKTGTKADSYESVRIAMNLLEADLSSAVYSPYNSSFFYFTNPIKTNTTLSGRTTVLWFPTKKDYLMRSGQHSLVVEAAYRLEPSYMAGSKQLYNLYYNITDDSDSTNYNYRSNSSAYSSISGTDYLLLENVCNFEINPISKGFSLYSQGILTNLPYVIEVKIEVIDDDGQAKKQYETSNDPVRTFRRFITINQGQEL